MNFRQTFERHMPTTIATLVALVFGFQIWLIGLLADLIAGSRRLTEEVLYRVKRTELELSDLRERGQAIVAKLDGEPAASDGANLSGDAVSAAEEEVRAALTTTRET
jgi:hypothetical protein